MKSTTTFIMEHGPQRTVNQLVLAVSMAFAAGLNFGAHAGGIVNFANNSSSQMINGQTSNPVTTSDAVQAALYWAPPGATNFIQIGTNVIVGNPVAGIFAGGAITTGPATTGGTAALFQTRAWSGGYSTYEQAVAAGGTLIGQSAIVQVMTGNPSGAPPTAPGSLTASGLASFTLTPAAVNSIDIGLRAYDGIGIIQIAGEAPAPNGQLTSTLRINKNGTNYGIVLTATNATNASKIRIQTSSGPKAWMKLP